MKKICLAAGVVAMTLFGAQGGAVAATSGAVEYTVVKVGINPGTVVARGVLNAAGTETNNRHLVPPGTPFQVTFTFTQGQLFQTATPSAPPQIVDSNPRTCVTRLTLRTTTVVTGGTGSLAGATGSGAGTANRTVVSGKNADGTCKPLSAPALFEVSYVKAPGTLTLP